MAGYLSKEEVKDIIDFSQALYIAENSGYYTPWMSNQLLKNLNTNPRIPSIDDIKEALSTYKSNEKNLQGYVEFMNNFDMIFKRTLLSYVNMLAFDYQYICTNAYTQSDLMSDAYVEDLKRIETFCDKFKPKEQFRRVAYECMVNDAYFTWFRKTKWRNKGMKFALQVMPQDYCLLTGYWEKGMLFDYDMDYFLQPGVDIDGFDPVFREYYNRVFGDNPQWANYRPTNPLNKRTGQFAYWVQTSPEDGAWVFKMQNSNFVSTPFLAPYVKDTLRDDEIEKLQYDKNMLAAYGILAGSLKTYDTLQRGDKPNQFVINPTVVSTFIGKAKNSLGELVKVAAMPTEDNKFFQFSDSNSDMYKDQLTTASGVGSGISRVIYTSDRMSNAEMEAGITDQFNTMAQSLYPQFANFMEFFANKLTKKYKFKFIFEGCTYNFMREKKFDQLVKLASQGMTLDYPAWASAIGMEPQDFLRSIKASKNNGWSENWQLPMNTNTTAQDGEGAGRPKSDSDDLSESGEMNRNTDGEL